MESCSAKAQGFPFSILRRRALWCRCLFLASRYRLLWAVREPFVSRHSSAEMVGGTIEQKQELVIGSQMDGNGVIFSDGIEKDFIEFNSGSIAAFKVSKQTALLVV